MENIKIVTHVTDEAQTKKGIRIECENEEIFYQIYNIILNIQPKIMEDKIFKTSKRLIVDSSYIDVLEKAATELVKTNSIQYGNFFRDISNIRKKIHTNEEKIYNRYTFN